MTNTTDAPKRVTVDLVVRRHRGSKETPLPTVTVPAKGSTNISLPAAALPDRSNGAAEIYAVTARYTDGGGDRVDPGSAFAVGWDAAFGSAWVGSESDAPEIGRRALASVAQRAGKTVPADLDGRTELFASLHSAIDVEDSDARTGQTQRRKANADDVLALPLSSAEGKDAVAWMSAKGAAAQTRALTGGTTVPIYWTVCFQWDTTGLYRDASGANQTAYVNAGGANTVTPAAGVQVQASWYAGGVNSYKGAYLDTNGCLPLTFSNGKPSSVTFSTSTERLGPPGQPLGTPGPSFRITPEAYMYFSLAPGAVSTGLPKTIASPAPVTLSGLNQTRIGAVVSRIFRMPDNGLSDGDASRWSEPGQLYFREALTSDRTTYDPDSGWDTPFNCTPYSMTDGSNRYGEACFSRSGTIDSVYAPDQVSYGQILHRTAAGTYEAAGAMTTIDRSTVAHEIGHLIHHRMSGILQSTQLVVASTPSGDPYDLCSCSQVSDGNARHCLQNRWDFASAFNEGFAHFFASRVENEDRAGTPGVASTCLFPYYKDTKTPVNLAAPSGPSTIAAPPVPVSCTGPGGSFGGVPRGWQRSYCNSPVSSDAYASQEGIERDVLTFLAALNSGKTYSASAPGFALGSGTIGMSDLAVLFRRTCTSTSTGYCSPSSGTGTFNWGSMQAAGQSQFGFLDARYTRLRNEATRHSVDGSSL